MQVSTDVYPYIRIPSDKDNLHFIENFSISVQTYYYLKIFSDFSKNLKYKIKWNWSAALFGIFWLAYRKMYVYAIGFLIIGFFFNFLIYILLKMSGVQTSNLMLNSVDLIITLIINFALGLYGNQLYIHFIKKNISKNRISNKNVSGFSAFIVVILIPILYILTLYLSHIL